MTTSTTVIQPNNQVSRIPTQRDFEIFRLAEIKGFTHAEIALDYRLTRRRVSQIVKRTRLWLAQHPCQDPRIASELQAKRLAQHTERMHLENVISQARHELACGKRQLSTTTEKYDGSKTTTCREQPFNVQVLKTYLRAVEGLGRINARPEIPVPPPPGDEFPWLMNAINEVYDKWYNKVWKGKKLTPDHFHDFVNDIAEEVLKAAKHQQELATRPPAAETPLPPGEGAERSEAGEGLQDVYRGSPDPADNTLARSASEGNVPSIPTPHSATAASLSTEYSVPSTLGHAQAPEASDQQNVSLPPGPLVSLSCSSASHASLASHREAPSSQETVIDAEAATPSAVDSCGAKTSAEIDLSSASTSQENPKREAPPLPPPCPLVSPSPCPTLALSAEP